MDYAIKQMPEDFFVRELIDLAFSEKGVFSYYTLRKREVSTLEAVKTISKKLNIQEKHINFAGTKDKKAVTEQAVSIMQGPKKDFDLGRVSLKYLGSGDERLNLGDNKGNCFEITLRNISRIPEGREWFINYFDDQRFSENNADIGRAIVKKDFEKAAKLIADNSNKGYETRVKEALEQQPRDFVGALRKMDKKVLKLYLHAYQSYLWNEKVSRKFDEMDKKIHYSLGKLNVPSEKPDFVEEELPGFSSEQDEIMKKEGIMPRDFIIKEIPGISSEGKKRKVVSEVPDMILGKEEADELNKGSRKIRISFTLPKGSYATMLVKQMFL